MKKFISPYGWFSMEYPDNWNEFEDEEGSFLFYNPNKWTGNLRVSASKDSSRSYASQVLAQELRNYPDAVTRTLGSWKVICSKETFTEEGHEYTCYTFLTGTGNTVIDFSFTVSQGILPKEAEQVVASLIVRDEKKHYPKEIIPVRVWEIHQIDEAFEWVSRTVRKNLKKDFTGDVSDLDKLQQFIDSGLFSVGQRETWEAIGIAFGVILTNEMDGMEWVTVIDGKKEFPALVFKGTDFYLEPMKCISAVLLQGESCYLRPLFEQYKAEIEQKL